MKLIAEREYGSTVRKAYIGELPGAPYSKHFGMIVTWDTEFQKIINQRNYYDSNKRKLAKKLRTYICVEDENDARHNRPDLFRHGVCPACNQSFRININTGSVIKFARSSVKFVPMYSMEEIEAARKEVEEPALTSRILFV